MNDSIPRRILIVEDNATYCKMLRIRLQSAGYEVFTAQDGLEGLEAVRKMHPDLILLDLMLPLMDGHKVSRLIKFDKKSRDIPIVVLTCKNLTKDVELAIEDQVDAFLIKGTKTEILLNVVKRLLEKDKKSLVEN